MESSIITLIIGLVIAGVGGIVGTYVSKRMNKKNKLEEISKLIEKNSKSIWRLNKTIVIMAKLLDDQAEKAHPELSSTLEEIADELLNENGEEK